MKEIEEAIEKTIETSDLENINVNLAEVAIDSVLEDGVLKDLPIVSIVVGLSKFGFRLRETIFLKKVLKFLSPLKYTSKVERQKFLKKIEESETYNKKVGEALIMILDKLTDLDKPKIIGKLFVASIKEEIDYQTFLQLSYLVENLFLPDIEYLRELNLGNDIELTKREELYRFGLMKRPAFGKIQVDSANEYEINDYGKKLLEIIDKE